MAFIQCECGERIDLNQPAAQVTCEGCGRTYTVPKLATPVQSPAPHATPAPHGLATPLSATMVEDLPAMTQVENPFGDSIVAMGDAAMPAAGLAASAQLGPNDSQQGQNLFSTPAQVATPASQAQIDTPAGGGFATELSPGLRLLDRYEIQRKIGQGGMSTVYEAFDSVRGEKVALKVLLPNLAAHPALQERFLQEGRLSSNFSHPNIARVYDLHQTESLIFLSMELLHGTTLRHDMNRRHDQRQAYRPTEVMKILDDVCDALEVVHADGVVHRDLKPENLWLGLDGSVKVMDFGIARDGTGTSFTNAGKGSGTPYYIAPEQLAASPTMDDRADQYSVGIISYELLTGELPQGAIVAPHEKNSAIPRKMSEAIFRALDAEPTNRFDNISSFREAAKFRTEKTWLDKITKPLATVVVMALVGFAFLRWGLPMLEKQESPIWEEMPTQRVVENQELRFTARSMACTIDSNALTFKLLSDAPVGASLDAKTGEFVWTPTEAQGPQEYNFTIMAVAGEEGRAPVVRERSFTVEVTESVDKPTFALPEPIQGKEHEELVYQIEASDPNVPAIGLRYELPELPPGMAVDHRTGEIRWVPNEQQGGANYQLAVRVYLEGEQHLNDFTERTLNVRVEESIDPPVITASDQFSGKVGEAANLRATVRDPNVPAIDDYFAVKNGDRLGMTIDPQSGEIFWTPTEEQIGDEQEVTIQILWDEAGKTSVLSEKVVQVTVAGEDEELPADVGESLADNNDPLGGSPIGGGFGSGLGGGGLGGGGGANCDQDCKKPNNSLPPTGQSSAPVFGGKFPSSVGGNTAGSGGGRPGGGGGASGGRGNDLGQVIDLIQKIKQSKNKQQGAANRPSSGNKPSTKPSFPTNKLPPGWSNKLPTTGIRLQDLQKKSNASKRQAAPTRVTRDLPLNNLHRSKLPFQLNSKQSSASKRNPSTQNSNQRNSTQRNPVSWKTKLPTTLQTRVNQANTKQVGSYRPQSRSQQSLRTTQSLSRQSTTRSSQTSRNTRSNPNRNGGNNRSQQSSQWDKLKKASSNWKRR